MSDGGTPIELVRIVVIDTETTGLNPEKDKIISLGAVALLGGDICVDDSFEATVAVDHNTSSVLYHGITLEESRKGLSETQALERFWSYIAGGLLAGHHVKTDLLMLQQATRRQNIELPLRRAIDSNLLAFALQEKLGDLNGHFINRFTLEELCGVFQIAMHDRHTAAGDAFLTAMLWQRLLRKAARAGWTTLEELLPICEVILPVSQNGPDPHRVA